MTTRWPRIPLAMFCCLLALAASAHAECAWVLGLNHIGVVAGEELDMWIPLNASTNNPGCQQVLAATLPANSRAAKPGDAVTLRGSNMIDFVSVAGAHTLLYSSRASARSTSSCSRRLCRRRRDSVSSRVRPIQCPRTGASLKPPRRRSRSACRFSRSRGQEISTRCWLERSGTVSLALLPRPMASRSRIGGLSWKWR